jgi:hypothetical protein
MLGSTSRLRFPGEGDVSNGLAFPGLFEDWECRCAARVILAELGIPACSVEYLNCAMRSLKLLSAPLASEASPLFVMLYLGRQ